jgi:hypothetical protein
MSRRDRPRPSPRSANRVGAAAGRELRCGGCGRRARARHAERPADAIDAFDALPDGWRLILDEPAVPTCSHECSRSLWNRRGLVCGGGLH